MKSKISYRLPLILSFILLNAFFFGGKSWLTKQGIDQSVLIAGNLIIFTATVLSFLIAARSFQSANPNASVSSMYKSFIVKFFICIIAAFAYIMAAKKNLNRPALFVCMGLYVLYTFIEVSALTRMLKEKKNA